METRNLDVTASAAKQHHSHQTVVIVLQQEPKLGQECLWVFHLDHGNQLIERELVLVGTITHSLIRPQEILRKAIANGTARIITVHSYPHNTIELSLEDLQIWRTLDITSETKGIAHLDHIVVSVSGGHISCCQAIEQGYTRGTGNNAQKEGAIKRVKAERSTIRQARSA